MIDPSEPSIYGPPWEEVKDFPTNPKNSVYRAEGPLGAGYYNRNNIARKLQKIPFWIQQAKDARNLKVLLDVAQRYELMPLGTRGQWDAYWAEYRSLVPNAPLEEVRQVVIAWMLKPWPELRDIYL